MEIQQRFSDAIWAKDARKISLAIGGAGGIGSWLSLFLTRIGYQCNIYDDDVVETHNIGGQLYGTHDVEGYKVLALKKLLESYSERIRSTFNAERITEDSLGYLICFSAFDNMQARKDFFNSWKKTAAEFPDHPAVFIDGRLEAEFFQVFCVTRETAEEYEKHLFLDSDLEEASCSFKQTSHCAALIAGFMTSFFTNFVSNIKLGGNIREVPFFFEYYVPINQFKIGHESRDT